MEGTSCLDPDPLHPDCPMGTPSCFDAGYSDPTFEYDTGSNCAVVGGFVYRGSAIPWLRGHYVFGDVCTKLIWALAGSPGNFTQVKIADGSFSPAFFGLTSFGEDVDGELYVTLGNEVCRLVPIAVPTLGAGALALLALALVAAFALWSSRAPG